MKKERSNRTEEGLSPVFVGMSNDGKYSDGNELYTFGLGGCIVTLLYFERDGRMEGILTHYSPLDVDSNIERLNELRRDHMDGKPQYQRGVILVARETDSSKSLAIGVRDIFPGVDLETILYDSSVIGTVKLIPSQKKWSSQQHGINFF